MQRRGSWIQHDSHTVAGHRFFSVVSDIVTDPVGRCGTYDWIAAPDQVRIGALTDGGDLHVIEQHHYLPNRPGMWQLPGGSVEPCELPRDAAARELEEEAGVRAQRWGCLGSTWPLPGLTQARVHLWRAEQLTASHPRPEASEADLTVRLVSLERAVTAVFDGTFGCTASAQLVLTLWVRGKDS